MRFIIGLGAIGASLWYGFSHHPLTPTMFLLCVVGVVVGGILCLIAY